MRVFTVTVTLSDPNFWATRTGGVSFHSNEGINDFDFYVYRRVGDKKGDLITAQGAAGGTGGVEDFTIPQASGSYYVAAVAFATFTFTTGTFNFFVNAPLPAAPPVVTNPPGFPSFRASHDPYTSHSEPHIAMNPLNHANLVAGSKMYVNNAHYLFRIGMYSSFDGGQTWSDARHLPVPLCAGPPTASTPPCSWPMADTMPSDCPNDGPFSPACLFTTSDIWLSFDDEGNVYGIVLVSASSNTGTGWEMWMYKSSDGGRTWPLANRRVIHDHIQRSLSKAFLDDKDAIVVDNYTAAGTGPNTGPNSPRDGRIGNIYACWGLDGSVAPTQTQVVSRSTDGGTTWGVVGVPFPVSGVDAREIGCQLAVAPNGRVYVSFFVYSLTAVIGQYISWSDDHGFSFVPPILVSSVHPVPNHLQAPDNFRNLSLPAMAVGTNGTIYVTWADEQIRTGGKQDADILLVKGTVTGGIPVFGNPVTVNQDGAGSDQFQPQIAVTASGQVNISYFDRRQDPNNFFIDTYLSRSNDGGATWTDTRVTQAMSDARVNPPIDGAGNFFYGDYQGLVADDRCAIPFWQDTHLANLLTTDPGYTPYQEVFSARIPNGNRTCPSGGGACHEGDGQGTVDRTDAAGTHRATFSFNQDSCEDGTNSDGFDEQDPDSGHNFHATQFASVAFDDVLHTINVTGSGIDAGQVVTFTMTAADSTGVPGMFLLILSNGYTIAGKLTSGVIDLGTN